MKLNKDDILDLTIENMGSDGEGVAKADGFPVFVKDAVAGDVCRIKITKVKKNYAYGHLMEVKVPSKDRVKEACPSAKRCGGCTIQAVSYERQLKFKFDRVYECLKRIGGITEDVLDRAGEKTEGMERPFRYRNKAQYPFGKDRNGNVISGFYAARSHEIVPTEDCLLLPEEFSGILKAVTDFIKSKCVSVYDERTNKGLVRHLLLKKAFATGEIMAVLVINGTELPCEEEYIRVLKNLNIITTALVNINQKNTNVILGEKERVLFGSGYITDILNGLKFRISARSFYQVNPVIASKIYDTVQEFAGLTGTEEVYDVCCGIGTMSLMLAKNAGRVVGIEIVDEAIEDAKINAGLNGITNAEFICAAAEDELPYLARNSSSKADAVVLDPPRSGMERPALDAVIAMSPEKIIYVSCDPATMARDVKLLCEKGYELKCFKSFDQFCQTGHVETVCLLSNRKPDSYVHLNLKMEDYYRIKDAEKEQGKK